MPQTRARSHTIRLKPLRERREAIIPHAKQFIADFNLKSGNKISVCKSVLQILKNADWRGNVRELRTIIEKACVATILHAERNETANEETPIAELTSEIIMSFLPKNEFSEKKIAEDINSDAAINLNNLNYKEEKTDFDRSLIETTLAKNNGNVSRTATQLNLSRNGLIKKIKLFKIKTDE